jgi:hypothetical protein
MKGATQYFPQASIVFDKFHVMVLVKFQQRYQMRNRN